MMRLLVFSLLTKIRPVSLAPAPEHGPARNAATRPRASRGRKTGRQRRLGARWFSSLALAEMVARQRTTYRSAGARREPNGFAGPRDRTCRAGGNLLMDERSRGPTPRLPCCWTMSSRPTDRCARSTASSFYRAARRVHRAARAQRRRQIDAVPAAVRPVRAGFRTHRGHGPRHDAQAGAGAGPARHRVPAADPRPRIVGHLQPAVPCRPARHSPRRRQDADREGAGAARARRPRP